MTLPLLWVSLAFMAGILLASLAEVDLLVWLVLGLLGLAGLLVAYSRLPAAASLKLGRVSRHVPRKLLLLALAALVSALAGAARYQSSLPRPTESAIAAYNDADHAVLVTGTLIEPPDVRDTYINLRLQARQLDSGEGPLPAHGLVLARISPNQNVHYGDTLRLRGRLLTPPSDEDFNYREYLARQGIRSYMPSATATLLPGRGGNPALRMIYALKEVSLQNIHRLFVDPEASLLAGILLGVDTGMPAKLEQAFNDTGTAHIIAISGFNIAIIAGVLAFAFHRLLGPRRGALAAAAGILFYAFFVGANPPVLRAAVMGLIALLAVQVGRRQTAVNTLAAVAAFLALLNPSMLWDVGFQLSVLATLGLMWYGGPFMGAARSVVERHLPASDARTLVSSVAEFSVLTLAAQLTTLPILAYHFKQISLVSPVANALILPAQPAVMVLGGLAVVVSLLSYPLGQLLAWVAWPLSAYTIRLVEFFDRLPHRVLYLGSFSLAFVALFYAVLLVATFGRAQVREIFDSLKTKYRRLGLAIAIVALFVLVTFASRLVAAAPDGRLHVTFLDVGSADAVLIQTPSGGQVLIGGGPSAVALSEALGRRLSPIDRHLDWLVIASTDEQQVGSLPRLLPRFPPEAVLLGAPEQASFSSAALMEWLEAGEIPLARAEPDQALQLGEGAELRVLDVSPRGLTLLLEWRAFRLLLPIGANLETLRILENGSTLGPVAVLLLAQGGYAPVSPPEWLENLHPQLVVISVAAADRDGMPSAQVLDALEGYSVLRTDQNGWIEIATDGRSMWVSAERQESRAP